MSHGVEGVYARRFGEPVAEERVERKTVHAVYEVLAFGGGEAVAHSVVADGAEVGLVGQLEFRVPARMARHHLAVAP